MRFFLYLVLLFLSSCSLFEKAIPPNPRLPSASHLPCCYQTVESLNIHDLNSGETFTMNAVLVTSEMEFTFLLIDSLGRRVLTISHSLEEPVVLSTANTQLAAQAHWLLTAVYLHMMPEIAWNSLSNKWATEHGKSRKAIYYNGSKVIEIEYPADDNSVSRTVHFIPPQLTLDITTVESKSL